MFVPCPPPAMEYVVRPASARDFGGRARWLRWWILPPFPLHHRGPASIPGLLHCFFFPLFQQGCWEVQIGCTQTPCDVVVVLRAKSSSWAGSRPFSLLSPPCCRRTGHGKGSICPCWDSGVSCPLCADKLRTCGSPCACVRLAVTSCQTARVFQLSDSAPALCFLGGRQGCEQSPGKRRILQSRALGTAFNVLCCIPTLLLIPWAVHEVTWKHAVSPCPAHKQGLAEPWLPVVRSRSAAGLGAFCQPVW